MVDLLIELVRPQHFLFYLFAYGLAAMPTSYGVAKIIHRIDLEKNKVHSHTASSMWKTMSKSSAVLVFVLDVLKGLIPCAIAQSLNAPLEVIALTGLFAVVGHCFSIFLKFFGGHGGATYAGAVLVIAYPAAIIALFTNFLMISLKLNAGASSSIAALVSLVLVYFLIANNVVWMLVAAMVAVILLRYRLSLPR